MTYLCKVFCVVFAPFLGIGEYGPHLDPIFSRTLGLFNQAWQMPIRLDGFDIPFVEERLVHCSPLAFLPRISRRWDVGNLIREIAIFLFHQQNEPICRFLATALAGCPFTSYSWTSSSRLCFIANDSWIDHFYTQHYRNFRAWSRSWKLGISPSASVRGR